MALPAAWPVNPSRKQLRGMAHSMVELLHQGDTESQKAFVVFDWGKNKKVRVGAKTKTNAEFIQVARWERQLGVPTAGSARARARDSTARAWKKLKSSMPTVAEVAGSHGNSCNKDTDSNQSGTIIRTTSLSAGVAVVRGGSEDSRGSSKCDGSFRIVGTSKSGSLGCTSAAAGGGRGAGDRRSNGAAGETNSPSARRCSSPRAAASASSDGSDNDCSDRSGIGSAVGVTPGSRCCDGYHFRANTSDHISAGIPCSSAAAAVASGTRSCGGYRFLAKKRSSLNPRTPGSSSVEPATATSSRGCGGYRFSADTSNFPSAGIRKSSSAVVGVGDGTGYNKIGFNCTDRPESGSGSSGAPGGDCSSSDDGGDSDGGSSIESSRTLKSYNSWVDSSDGSGSDQAAAVGSDVVGDSSGGNDHESDDHGDSGDHDDNGDLRDDDSDSSGGTSSRSSTSGAADGTIGSNDTVSDHSSKSSPAAEALALDDCMNSDGAGQVDSPTVGAHVIGGSLGEKMTSSNAGAVMAGTCPDGRGRSICGRIFAVAGTVAGGGGASDTSTSTSTLLRAETGIGDVIGGSNHNHGNNANRRGPGDVTAMSRSGDFDTARKHSSGLQTAEVAAGLGVTHGSSFGDVDIKAAGEAAGGTEQQPEEPLPPDDPNNFTDEALIVAFLQTHDGEVWHALVSIEQSARDRSTPVRTDRPYLEI